MIDHCGIIETKSACFLEQLEDVGSSARQFGGRSAEEHVRLPRLPCSASFPPRKGSVGIILIWRRQVGFEQRYIVPLVTEEQGSGEARQPAPDDDYARDFKIADCPLIRTLTLPAGRRHFATPK